VVRPRLGDSRGAPGCAASVPGSGSQVLSGSSGTSAIGNLRGTAAVPNITLAENELLPRIG
jgi:hypothetical protein